MDEPELSIVVPCFNEGPTVNLFYKAVEMIKEHLPTYQYIFVDDGSKDDTLNELKALAKKNENVHYISFSRNFGKEAALFAGLKHANTPFTAIMDADLQDPPEMLVKMLQKLKQEQVDVVVSRRSNRDGENIIISALSHMYYYVANKLSTVKMEPDTRDFRVMRKIVVDAFVNMQESSRFAKGLFSWEGFKISYVSYPNQKRIAGESHWGFRKLVKYALTGVMDFSQTPLKLAIYLGTFFFIASIIGFIYVIIRKLLDPTIAVRGWTSLAALILMIGSLNLLCLGIIGSYISKIYQQVKKRPIYIVREEK